MTQLLKAFPTLQSYYEHWDSLDHTKHQSKDFALHCIIVSTLKDETPQQTFSRLRRAFSAIHSYKKWEGVGYGRWRFDTLERLLLSMKHNYAPQCYDRDTKVWGENTNTPYVNWTSARVYYDSLLELLPGNHDYLKKPNAEALKPITLNDEDFEDLNITKQFRSA